MVASMFLRLSLIDCHDDVSVRHSYQVHICPRTLEKWMMKKQEDRQKSSIYGMITSDNPQQTLKASKQWTYD